MNPLKTYVNKVKQALYGAMIAAPLVLGGCQSAPFSLGEPSVRGNVRAIGGHESSTIDAKVFGDTPLTVAGNPVGYFVRDRLSVNDYEDASRVSNFSITDLNYGAHGFKVLAGARTISSIDTDHTHEGEFGRVDMRAGAQYFRKFETDYGTFTVLGQGVAVIDPQYPRENPTGSLLATVTYRNNLTDEVSVNAEVETLTDVDRHGVFNAIQRLEATIGYGAFSIGPRVDLQETRDDRDPSVNVGGVLRVDF